MQTEAMKIQWERAETAETRSDEDLMSLYARGDAEAFETLFHRHKGSVYAFIYRFMASGRWSDDLFQTVFLRIIHNRHHYRPTAKFTTWLYTITRSVCIDAMRKNKRNNVIRLFSEEPEPRDIDEVLVPEAEEPLPRRQLMEAELQEILDEVIAALPESQREVLLLRETTDMTFAEIGEAVGCSVNTVKSRMHYALLAMRRGLQERGIE